MSKKDPINWQKYLGWTFNPIAVGLYITAATIMLTVRFYDVVSLPSELQKEGLSQVLLMAHQSSIDFRLRTRGPRPVSPNLALLTVDERAVATIGRWPWPRDVMAKAIDNAFKYDARLLAFDMVFSEPSQNPAHVVLTAAQEDGEVAPELSASLTALSSKLDADAALAQALRTHSDRVVNGVFSQSNSPLGRSPATEFCRDLVFKRTPAAKQWDKEEILLSVTDTNLQYMPAALTEFFQLVLSEKESAVREHFGPPKNRNEEVALEMEIDNVMQQTCDTILDDFREDLNANWEQGILAQENPKEFNYPTYDAWLAEYRAKVLPNAVGGVEGWVMNTPEISAGAKHTAFFNADLDGDGTIRRKSLIMRTGNTYFPSLALKAFLVAKGFNAAPRLDFNPVTQAKEIVDFEITNNDTGESEFRVPADGKSFLLINYAGRQQMYPYLSFADLLSDSPEATIAQRVFIPESKTWEIRERKVKKAEFIKDKIFLVGATATGIFDLRVTPFEENYPGAETHLNVIDNLIAQNFFRYLPDERVKMVLTLAAIGFILSVALNYLGALWGMVLTVSMFVAAWQFDQHVLFKNGVVIAIIWPMFLILTLYISLTFYRYLTEERGKKELRQTFQKYVSPAIVEEILSDPKNIELGGKKTRVTVFFSDVRGFTTISEKLDPRALSDLLNSYLTPMTEIVFKNRGTLDKYMGDAIMAFFGAPIPYPDHAKYACRCALQSVTKLFELQKQYVAKGLPAIDLGIGLNTGEVSVGNMGSETVRSYTVMGDAVNLASRLEGINKQYGTRIILSEMTYNDVKDNFICREVDWVRVKGKALPVKIYELIAEEKVPSAHVADMLKWFHEGYEHYHSRAWQRGLDSFSKALDINPADEVSKLYIQRCQDYMLTPPDDTWDGVFVMKTK